MVDVERPSEGPPVGDPVSIEIAGEDFEVLGDLAAQVRRVIGDIPGLVSLDDDFDLARPEVVVTVNRAEAARLGLNTSKIASTVRTAVTGTEASTYRDGDDDIDITVRADRGPDASLNDLAMLAIVTDDGQQIPLGSIARVERGTALTSIRHKGQARVVTVTGRSAPPIKRSRSGRRPEPGWPAPGISSPTATPSRSPARTRTRRRPPHSSPRPFSTDSSSCWG